MELEYELIRSGRKTLALEVTRDGRVLIRAPFRADQRQIDQFYLAHQDWLRDKLAQQKQYAAGHPEPTPEEQQALLDRARALLPGKLAYWAKIMNLHPTGLTITGARTRFGSCSSQGRICFSWRLMAYPEEAIDYVVVHELAHLVHRNHGPDFYALVASVLPDYKRRIALLKE